MCVCLRCSTLRGKHTLGVATREKQTNTVSFAFFRLPITSFQSQEASTHLLSRRSHFDHRFYLMPLGFKITPLDLSITDANCVMLAQAQITGGKKRTFAASPQTTCPSVSHQRSHVKLHLSRGALDRYRRDGDERGLVNRVSGLCFPTGHPQRQPKCQLDAAQLDASRRA